MLGCRFVHVFIKCMTVVVFSLPFHRFCVIVALGNILNQSSQEWFWSFATDVQGEKKDSVGAQEQVCWWESLILEGSCVIYWGVYLWWADSLLSLQAFVCNVNELHDKCLLYVSECFLNDSLFHEASYVPSCLYISRDFKLFHWTVEICFI